MTSTWPEFRLCIALQLIKGGDFSSALGNRDFLVPSCIWTLALVVRCSKQSDAPCAGRRLEWLTPKPVSETSIHCALQLTQGGDLCSALGDEDIVWYKKGHSIALDIVRGLAFLHSHNVSIIE